MVTHLPTATSVPRVNVVQVVVEPLLRRVVDDELHVRGSHVRLDIRQVSSYYQLGLGVLLGKVEAPVPGPGADVEHAPREVVFGPWRQVRAVAHRPSYDVVGQAQAFDLFCVVREEVPWDVIVGLVY